MVLAVIDIHLAEGAVETEGACTAARTNYTDANMHSSVVFSFISLALAFHVVKVVCSEQQRAFMKLLPNANIHTQIQPSWTEESMISFSDWATESKLNGKLSWRQLAY